MDEIAALNAAMAGDLEAFNKLVLAYQDLLCNYAFRMLGDTPAAQDAVQDTFLIAYRKLSTFRGGCFKSWLLRITTNLCLDQLRKIKRQPSIPLDLTNDLGEECDSPYWLCDPAPSPEEIYDQQELSSVIQQKLLLLSPKLRLVVVLIDMNELDYDEAAKVIGVPTGTIKSRLARARVFLRSELIPEQFTLKRERVSIYTNSMNHAARIEIS